MSIINILLAVFFLILIAIVYLIYNTTQQIKYKRQKGVDLRNKNAYYKFIGKTFLKKLPS
jgi:uncharacterized protein YpmB